VNLAPEQPPPAINADPFDAFADAPAPPHADLPTAATPAITPTPASTLWLPPEFDDDLLAHVRRYAEHGMALVPIEPGSKAPKVRGWQTTQPEAPDVAVARIGQRLGYGVGVVLGTSNPELGTVPFRVVSAGSSRGSVGMVV
jgi:hypothetical protein